MPKLGSFASSMWAGARYLPGDTSRASSTSRGGGSVATVAQPARNTARKGMRNLRMSERSLEIERTLHEPVPGDESHRDGAEGEHAVAVEVGAPQREGDGDEHGHDGH